MEFRYKTYLQVYKFLQKGCKPDGDKCSFVENPGKVGGTEKRRDPLPESFSCISFWERKFFASQKKRSPKDLGP